MKDGRLAAEHKPNIRMTTTTTKTTTSTILQQPIYKYLQLQQQKNCNNTQRQRQLYRIKQKMVESEREKNKKKKRETTKINPNNGGAFQVIYRSVRFGLSAHHIYIYLIIYTIQFIIYLEWRFKELQFYQFSSIKKNNILFLFE